MIKADPFDISALSQVTTKFGRNIHFWFILDTEETGMQKFGFITSIILIIFRAIF